MKFRKQCAEQTQPMHPPQRFGSMGLDQDAAEMLPKLWPEERLVAAPRHFRLYEFLGFPAQPKSVSCHHFEQAQQQERILVEPGRLADKDTPPDDGEICIRQTRSPVLIERVEA